MHKLVVAFTTLSLVLVVLCAPSYAQNTNTAKPAVFGKNTPANVAACEAAIASRNFTSYKPQYFGLKGENPVNGTTRVRVQLEHDMCINLLIVGGYQIVAQAKGDWYRADKMADGSLVLTHRDDCGNPGHMVATTAPAPAAVVAAAPTPAPAPAPQVEVVKVAEGISVKIDIKNIIKMEEVSGRNVAPVVVPVAKKGFCSSKKCRLGALLGAGAAGYAAYYYAPCWKK